MVDLLLIVAGIGAIPLIGRAIKVLIELLVKLIVGTFSVLFFAMLLVLFFVHLR
jgi:hypothetical protein